MQVASGRFEYLLRVRYNVVPTEQEFFQLKPETFLQAQRAAGRTHAADDFGSLSGNEKDQNFIPGGEILDQSRLLGERRLKGIDRCNRYLLQRCVLGVLG